MHPIEFPEHNAVFAKDQPPYKPLPVFKEESSRGELISCWQLSWRERLRILYTGKLWLAMLTFNKPPMPMLPTTQKSDVLQKLDPEDVSPAGGGGRRPGVEGQEIRNPIK